MAERPPTDDRANLDCDVDVLRIQDGGARPGGFGQHDGQRGEIQARRSAVAVTLLDRVP